MLSSVQPVTAIDPSSKVPSPAGVSTAPMGGEGGAVVGTVVSVTLIGPTVFVAPVSTTLMLPVCEAVMPVANRVEITNTADPLPEAGVTFSHGLFDVAVHVTVPAPVWESRTICGT